MAKATPVRTADEFFLLIEKSGLLAAEQLAKAKASCPSEADPKAVARDLLKSGSLTTWQAAQLLSGFYRLKIGNYILRDQIGKGEMGRVFLATHATLGRQVAIKALSPQHTSRPELVKRFLKEAQAAGALEHDNIVQVQDVSSEGDRHFVVMEYVKGKDLQQRVIDSGPLVPREVIEIVGQVAKGLRFAHDNGIIHADLKPANVLVNDQGGVKILDMGVGQLRQAEKASTESAGEILLSAISYMSPEQARGIEADARSDVYALGGVMYYMLTGRVPFSAKSDEERRAIGQSKRPLPIKSLRPDAPDRLVECCGKMMAIRRDGRFTSMKEIIDAFDKIEDPMVVSEPVKKETPPAESEAKKTPRFGWVPDESKGRPAEPKSTKTPPDNGVKREPAVADNDAPEVEVIIEADDKAKSKKQKAATTKSPDKPAKHDPPAAPPERPKTKTKKNAIPLGVVLAIAGSVCIVLALGGTLFVVLRPGKADPGPAVAQNSEDKAATAAVDPEADVEDIEDEPVDIEDMPDPETDNGATQPSSETAPDEEPQGTGGAASAGPGTESTQEPETPAATAETDNSAPRGPVASKPKTDDEGAMAADDPSMEEAAAAKPETTTPAPTEPEPGPKDPAPKKPATSKPDARPKPKPTEKPKQEKPPVKTFDFQAAVNLPQLPSAENRDTSRVLGKINIQQGDLCFIRMVGGENALRGRSTFALRNANGGTSARDWEVVLGDPSSGETIVATMTLPDSELVFAWSPAASDQPSADYLRNCSLQITAGDADPQELQLRTPESVAPITIDLAASDMSARWSLVASPDPASIRVDASVKGHQFALDPPQAIEAAKGEQWIHFGENREQSAVALFVEVNVTARGVEVEATPYFKVPGMPQPMQMTKPNVQQFESRLRGMKAREVPLKNMVQRLEKVPREKRAQVQNQVGQARLELQTLDEWSKQADLLRATQDAVNEKAKLNFRVFYDTLDKQVDLLVTDAPDAPPAKKGRR